MLNSYKSFTVKNDVCKENGGCTELCLLRPAGNTSQQRTCRCGTNTTKAVIADDENEMCCEKGFTSKALDENKCSK